MGGGSTKPMANPGITSTENPEINITNCPTVLQFSEPYIYLIVAFVAGILLTLLVTVIICLIKKCCHKDPTSLSGQTSHTSDPSHKHCSSAEEALTCAYMSLQDSEEKRVHFAQGQNEDSDPIVYAQIKVQTKASLPTNGS
ncbi:transmembrane protein C1orf162 homolog isoform X2 [Dromiciops gliroides]|nr:transmembrane protein C1orf162 homolog isoform X2 [Dromiciops gliroides]